MNVDLKMVADRLQKAAERCSDLTLSVVGADLIVSKDGYGAYQSATVPITSLFREDEDTLGKALDRLESGENPKAA